MILDPLPRPCAILWYCPEPPPLCDVIFFILQKTYLLKTFCGEIFPQKSSKISLPPQVPPHVSFCDAVATSTPWISRITWICLNIHVWAYNLPCRCICRLRSQVVDSGVDFPAQNLNFILQLIRSRFLGRLFGRNFVLGFVDFSTSFCTFRLI